MSNRIASDHAVSRPSLSPAVTTIVAAIAAVTFSAGGAAPTPLYHQYQQSFHLSPFLLTIVFAAYVLSLLTALLTVGSLSDHIGRRPAILAALGLNIAAMILFATADSALILIVARAMQGFSTGLATATLAAAILDNDRGRGPVLNSITAFGGLSAGTLGSAALVSYAPYPGQLVYAVVLLLSVAEAFILWHMPESVQPKPGALKSLRPHVSIPAAARGILMRATPATIASWALGGFYFSLMPSLVRLATGATSPLVGGLVVSALTLSGMLTVLALRHIAPRRILVGGTLVLALGVAITLAGVASGAVWPMLLGTIVAGTGFGSVFSGTMRTILPLAKPDERAGLVAAFYVEGYLSFSLPAMLAGSVAPVIGLTAAAYIYGASVITLALASFATFMATRPASKSKLAAAPRLGTSCAG